MLLDVDTPANVGPPQASLARLLDSLGSTVVQAAVRVGDADVLVTEPVIHDPLHPDSYQRGDIILAVGIAPESREAADLARTAAESGVAAIAFKFGERLPPRLVEIAESSAITLLGIPRDMAWGQFHTLVRTALSASGTVSEAGQSGVPIGDLFGLVNALAAVAGGAVSIEDGHNRVLAYSNLAQPIDELRRQTILGRRVPDRWLQRLHAAGVYRRLGSSDELVHFEDPDDPELRPRLVAPVRAGDELLGSIWVAQGDQPFPAAAEPAVREAARLAALHLVRHRAVERLERRNRADLLRSVLDGGGSAEGVAASLGLAVDAPYAVLGFESVTTDPITQALQREPLLDLVTLGAELFSRRAACTWTQRGVYVLVPVDPRQPGQRLVEFAASIIEQSERALRVPTRAAVGSTVPSLRDAGQSRWEVDQILRVLTEDPRQRQVATMPEVRSLVILAELRDVLRERPHLRAGRIDVLREYDARHATGLVAALRAYLESFRNIPAAAERLGLHENTYRYRLRKALDLSELDVDDPDERLVAELQLRLTAPPVL